MNKVDWTIEQRQAPIGLILFFGETVRKVIKTIWPLLILFVIKERSSNKDELYFWGLLIGVLFVLINTILSYLFFKFQIVNHEFVVKKGYLRKIRLSVPLDRIQTVNTKQNILQKIIRVVTLEIDTAGAKETEVKLIAIKEELAEDLQETIRAYSKTSEESNKAFGKEETIFESFKIEKGKTIIRLDMLDLFKVGLTENHLRSLLIVVSLFYGFYYQVKDVFESEVEQYTQQGIEKVEQIGINFHLILFSIFLVLLVSVFISMSRTFLKFYDLKLSQYNNAFKIRFGLFNTKEINVPINKIQVISWHKNPLRQLLKIQTLKIRQATSAEKIRKKQSIEIPAFNFSHQIEVENAVFGIDETLFSSRYRSHGFYFVRMFVLMSIPILALFIYFLDFDFKFYLLIGLCEISLLAYVLLSYKRHFFRISEAQLEISKGAVSQTIYRLQNFKIQAVSFTQNALIKRRKLANIIIYTATGEQLKIPYIQEDIALHLYHFLLYKVESSSKAWM